MIALDSLRECWLWGATARSSAYANTLSPECSKHLQRMWGTMEGQQHCFLRVRHATCMLTVHLRNQNVHAIGTHTHDGEQPSGESFIVILWLHETTTNARAGARDDEGQDL